LSVLFACSDGNSYRAYRAYLDKAEELLEEYPDSALVYLDSIPSPELLKEKDAHDYYLLRVQGRNKTRQDISKDTALLELRGYYDKSDPSKAAIIYLYSGKVFEQQKNQEEAFKSYLEAENLCDDKNPKIMGIIQNAIGNLLFAQWYTEDAKKKYQEALNNYCIAEDVRNQITALNLIGNCFLVEKKLDSAYIYYDRCLELIDQIESHAYISVLLNNLSIAYRTAGDSDKAKAYLEMALQYPLDNKEKAKINYGLAKIHANSDDLFYFYVNNAIDLIKNEADPLFESALYSSLSKHEENKGEYFAALDYHKRYIIHKESFLNNRYEGSLKDLQHSYYVNTLVKDNMKLVIRQQKIIIVSFIVGFIVLLSLLFAVGYIYKQRKELEDAEKNIDYLGEMAQNYDAKEKTLKNIVLKNFNILKKVALLEQYMVTNPTSGKLLKKFHEIVYNQDSIDWNQLYETMNSLHNNLFDRLKDKFPILEETEFRICCLTVAKFSNTEMSIIMGYSPNTIQAKKAIIRRKLGVKPTGNIGEFLYNYFGKS